MDRHTPARALRWLLLPASWVLLASALSLHQRGYMGLSLRPDGRVESVDAGGPGAMAGVRPGDVLLNPDPAARDDVLAPSLSAAVSPGEPVVVVRERDGQSLLLWLAPVRQPESERRYTSVLFAVAATFLLLGSWVWRERRDRLTRTFFLLCLAFSVMLAPTPHLHSRGAIALHQYLSLGAQRFMGP
ncbi:MAG: hypothetical protein ABL977_17385, partial [Candidatus Eisenbacteria bacterium]